MNRLSPTIRGIALLALGLVYLSTAGARTPWTQPKKGGFFQLAAYGIGPYDRLYQSSGSDFALNREITDNTVEAYAEYGVTENWTILAVLPFKQADAGRTLPNPTLTPTTGVAGSFKRLGNAVIGARRKLVDRQYTLSGQLDIEMPTGSVDEATGLSTGYDAFTFAPTVSAGKGWQRAYVFGYGGLGLRTNDFSSDWRVGLEGGYAFFERNRVWLVGLADLRRSFENGDVVLPRTNLETGLYVNDQEFLAYGGKILIDIGKGFGIQGTYYTATQGNNVPRSTLAGLGVYYRWGYGR